MPMCELRSNADGASFRIRRQYDASARSGLSRPAVVEHALGAVANLDARAGGAPHELQALRDVVQPCIGDGLGPGHREVVGHTVHGHSEVGHQVVAAVTGLIRNDDPGAARGQRPGVGGFVEHRPVEVAVFQHSEIGYAGLGEPLFGALDADDDDVVTVFGHCGRKPVRRHIRRAIGPIRPTSSRKAASGAKPVT